MCDQSGWGVIEIEERDEGETTFDVRPSCYDFDDDFIFSRGGDWRFDDFGV